MATKHLLKVMILQVVVNVIFHPSKPYNSSPQLDINGGVTFGIEV